MRYPEFWDKRVTLYVKTEDKARNTVWIKTILDGCCWGLKAERIPSGDNFIVAPVYTVRVPTGKLIRASTGDMCVMGDVDEDIDERTQGIRSSDLLKRYEGSAFAVRIFKDNTGANMPIPHYFIGG
jgi:hypothetical protein